MAQNPSKKNEDDTKVCIADSQDEDIRNIASFLPDSIAQQWFISDLAFMYTILLV